MRPVFRTDLKCSREEQQGVVFYRVDDPTTQTSFRLYEIEYLIAQKLDGQRELADVIQTVKAEHNFDISEPDLKKFITQLESMGFLAKVDEGGGEGAATAAEGGGDPESTLIMRRPNSQPVELAPGPDLLETTSPTVDEAELKRLLKSALLHVRQGYIVHARDYFLAARELNPQDPRIAKLVSHLEIVGDASGPAEAEYLWNQARELFPEVAEEVAPLAEASSEAAAATSAPAEGARRSPVWDKDLKTRVLLFGLFLLLVCGGGGGLYFFAKKARVFEGAARAVVATVRSKRVPIFHESAAESVKAARETWLKFATAGKVADLSVATSARVANEQILASLELAPAVQKQLEAARVAVPKAEAEYEKAAAKLEKVLAERDSIESERAAADAKLEELKSKNLLTTGGASKRDLEKWKKVRAKANKKLSALAKKERGPRAAEEKAKKKVEEAKKKVESIETKIAQKLIRAPFAGTVIELKIEKGGAVTAEQNAILLRDSLEARLSFVVKDAGGLAAGGEAFVSVSRGAPSRAKVASVTAEGDKKRIDVTLTDPAGSFIEMATKEFRLVREFAEPAFEVPATAVFSDEKGAHVVVELQGRALLRDVEVLASDAANAVIRDKSGALRDGEHLVVQRVGDGGEGGVASIIDGSFLEIQN